MKDKDLRKALKEFGFIDDCKSLGIYKTPLNLAGVEGIS